MLLKRLCPGISLEASLIRRHLFDLCAVPLCNTTNNLKSTRIQPYIQSRNITLDPHSETVRGPLAKMGRPGRHVLSRFFVEQLRIRFKGSGTDSYHL